MWAMLAEHWACGANTLFDGETSQPKHNEKESHYMASITGTPSRDRYTAAYLLSKCATRCFVEATPGNMIAPLAAARLRSMMSASEAVRPPCAALARPSRSCRRLERAATCRASQACERARLAQLPEDSKRFFPRPPSPVSRIPARAQARARFIIQLREPLSRHTSYMHMQLRFNRSLLSSPSVQRITELQLQQWEGYVNNRPELLAMMEIRPAVRDCNAAPLSRRKSPECAATATKAAGFAAQLLSGCRILPFREDQLGNETPTGLDPVTIGYCTTHTYPPVRPQPAPLGDGPPRRGSPALFHASFLHARLGTPCVPSRLLPPPKHRHPLPALSSCHSARPAA
jgi:hypothetical protein